MKSGVDYAKEAWVVVKPNLVPWIIVTIVGGALSMVFGLGIVGLARAAKKARAGEKPEIGDALWGLKNNPVQNIIAGIGSMIGACLCGIGLLYLGPRLMFAVPAMANEDATDGMAALKSSWGKTGEFMDHFVRWLTIMVIGGIGSVVCGIGSLVTFPIALVALDAVYEDFKKEGSGDDAE